MPPTTRRHLLALAVSAGAAMISSPGLLLAQTSGYAPVAKPVVTASAEHVEVLEFMWLGCPHCYRFEPAMLEWKKDMPAHATFVREAPPLNPSWEQHSRGFYAARVLGLEEQFVKAMFSAIHENGDSMRKPKDIAALAATIGADEAEFLKTMSSFAVETAIKRSVQLAVSAGINAVPSVMINGKFITSASLAGGNDGMIDVIEQMVEVEKNAMGL